MPEMQVNQKLLSGLLSGVERIDDSVVRGKKIFKDKTYAVAYIDFSDQVVDRSQHLRDFQERILGDTFFESPGDLRWNNYVYFVAGENSVSDPGFFSAKATIESDRDYARKRVILASELEAELGGGQLFDATASIEAFDVMAEWRRQLSAGHLGLLMDCATPRTSVVEKIATRNASEPANAIQRQKEINIDDAQLAECRIDQLRIERFRPIHDGKSYSFGQVTLIVGANGSGKTSLLEAIESFYCGGNRRSKSTEQAKISASLRKNGSNALVRMSSVSDVPRIKARCLAWYNRNEHSASAILDSFSQYNFLDTDAAFRLSATPEQADIATELSRLLVGASAATTFEYLQKIYADIEKAREKAGRRADGLQSDLDASQRRLNELLERPSVAKTLANSYQSTLTMIGWRLDDAVGPLDQRQGSRLLDALSCAQTILSFGDAARTAEIVESRLMAIESAVSSCLPLDERLRTLSKNELLLSSAIERDQKTTDCIDRWIAYKTAKFEETRHLYNEARELVESLSTRLGGFVSSDLPSAPAQYEGQPLSNALKAARRASEDASRTADSARQLLSVLNKEETARAEVAVTLRDAALAALKTSPDQRSCPVCRTTHAEGELERLIDRLAASASNSPGITALTASLVDAERSFGEARAAVSTLELCEKIARSFGLDDPTPAVVAGSIADLKMRLDKAKLDLQIRIKEGQNLRSAGFSGSELDSIWLQIRDLFDTTSADVTINAAIEAKQIVAHGKEERSKELDSCRRELDEISKSIQSICHSLNSDGWSSSSDSISTLPALIALRESYAPLRDSLERLRTFVDLGGATPLAEIRTRIAVAANAFNEAVDALRKDSSSSEELKALSPRIEEASKQLLGLRSEEAALRDASEVLSNLFSSSSLEFATREALEEIGSKINEIFSRIHAPKEYMYSGSSDAQLQTIDGNEPRSLNQVSTGQRAAFALSIFLARNQTAKTAPPILLIDDPIAHIDDLNALSFLDYLRDLSVHSNRQVFFATADTRIASLFSKKFSFLGEDFKTITLDRAKDIEPSRAD
ncbi:AAA family ATPase [Silanimonas sp.]|uniref:AAA family ATPase n=1 Tax=Silanimonas sp. TaxID=1929290 RepID=UPI0022C44CDE|nr:AAA family ATPase [Silanimonas sp.]MCZ8061759.1 AAA family ATPase [Silanimonas sp.]